MSQFANGEPAATKAAWDFLPHLRFLRLKHLPKINAVAIALERSCWQRKKFAQEQFRNAQRIPIPAMKRKRPKTERLGCKTCWSFRHLRFWKLRCAVFQCVTYPADREYIDKPS